MEAALALLGLLLAGGGIAWALAVKRENRPDRVLALLYHRLVSDLEYAACTPSEKIFSISEERFREQMAHLSANGYRVVSPEAVAAFVEKRTPLPPRSVLISFDDGCASVYAKAMPILREFGMPGILFVTTDPQAWIFSGAGDAQRRVTPEEMRELEAEGIAIGSHAVTHEALEEMEEDRIAQELGTSKRHLESVLGHPVPYFAVPLNWYGRKVRAAAETCGYRAVFTSDSGTIHGGSDLFHLPRILVDGSFSVEEFARSLSASAVVQRRYIGLAKRLPGRILGPRIWLPLRRRLFASSLGRYFTFKSIKRILTAGTVGLIALLLAALWTVLQP